ncbi:hypothetical protein [Aminobacter sp. Piv2-1]|uniref:hypothetical protein n=1 Tax=Aminobacter sp. Piv2-1 TaxID=3031122 RepID=UPI0030A411F5
MKKISLVSMLLGERQTPLWPDNDLESVGRFLGPPDRWDFGIENHFSCQLGYGDVEIDLQARDNRVVVTRFWLNLWDTRGGEPAPKTAPIRLSRRIKVDLGGFHPGLAFPDAKALLDSLDVEYQEFDRDDASEIVKTLRTTPNVELRFFRSLSCPILMEIHAFSANE